jgi:hypothetical protein
MIRLGKFFVVAVMAVAPMACKNETRKEADRQAEDLKEAKEDLREESKELKESLEEQREDTAEHAKAAADEADENRVAGLPESAARKVNEEEVEHNAKQIADESKDVASKAQKVATKEAEFDIARMTRVQQLRGSHMVMASQPMLINTIAQGSPLTDKARADLAEKMQVFQMRIDEAGNAIEVLQVVSENAFEDANDKAAKAMDRLDDAREDAWEALNDGDRIDPS